MLKFLDKYFPELTDFIKRLSLGRRLLLLLLLGGIFLLFSAGYRHRELIIGLLQQKIEISILQLFLTLFSILLFSAIVATFIGNLRRKGSLLRFCQAWLDFTDFLFSFISKIEIYLEHESKTHSNKFHELEKDLVAYHSQRAKLRELLHIIGEKNLIVTKVHNWDDLKSKYDIFQERNYKTPFSFLLDFVNPIAFVNHHGKEAWEAMHISNEFIEYMSYEHRYIRKRLTAERQ